MIDRRCFLLASSASLLFGPEVLAQQQARRPLLGYLGPATREAAAGSNDAFLRAMSDLGYIEGRTIAIEWRYADGYTDRFLSLAQDLVRLAPDVILAIGDTPVELSQATKTIPIVSTNVAESIAAELVGNLARPAGNLTGVLGIGSGILIGKQFEIVTELVPGAATIGLMDFVGGADGGGKVREEAAKAAAALGVKLVLGKYSTPDDIEAAFRMLARERVAGVVATGSTAMAASRAKIVALAEAERLPTIYSSPQFVLMGGLLSYSNDQRATNRRAATFVAKILKGARPADLPMEVATPSLSINLKTARSLGLSVPLSVLVRADEVVE